MALSRRNEAEAERFRVKLKNCKAGHNRSQKIIRLQVWRLNRKNRADNFKNTSKLKPVYICAFFYHRILVRCKNWIP
jgi:RNA polymerase-associated protein RTF1